MYNFTATEPDSPPNLVRIIFNRLLSPGSPMGTVLFESVQAFLTILVPIAFYYGWEIYKHNRGAQSVETEDEIAYWRRVWQTPTWSGFWALSERYIFGSAVPWGPWDVTSIKDLWEDQESLHDLLRWGILPMAIRPGGLMSYKVKEFRMGPRGLEWPEYIHSKGRAYIQFIVPYPNGHGTDINPDYDTFRWKFMQCLNALPTNYPVNISISKYNCALEEGEEAPASDASSRPSQVDDDYVPGTNPTGGNLRDLIPEGQMDHFAFFASNPPPSHQPLEVGTRVHHTLQHFFKKPQVIIDGVGLRMIALQSFTRWPEQVMPLVYFSEYAVVHIEARDTEAYRLDQVVRNLAWEAGAIELRSMTQLSDRFARLMQEIPRDARCDLF
ncbi:hypothetical protein B0J11DRAFT_64438 [Dendryphion nanum]|uniref:Uncharacterized protein n=1 Tax=Dendryphion nanum TaxID=256645 RepID=A0A9P9DHM8_9PLEO|nr:hypothetical protein B0J11DRAFT_64438 [Dendryphion nanum]